jgi:dihydrofolate reductase
VPSDELFQWWSDRVGATGLALYGRRLWETMSSHWPTADQQPGATPAQIEFARRWRDMPKVVFSSTISTVDWNTRLVTGDAVTEITRLSCDVRRGRRGLCRHRSLRARYPLGVVVNRLWVWPDR